VTAPPFAYFGGKTQLAPRIAALLPPHQHYVEPFAGSLAVLLAKPPSAMETVSDLDGDIVTFWRVLRDQPEHQSAYQRPDGLTDLERARRVWVLLTQGRAGMLLQAGWRHFVDPTGSGAGMAGNLRGYVSRLGPAAARLAEVSLESLPALDLIAKYGAYPNVLIYADPPYLGSTRSSGGYRCEMTGADEHKDLLAALLDCKAAVVLSGYTSPLYDEMLHVWDRVTFATGTGQASKGVWSTRTEVLWSNRPLGDQPSLFDEAAS
jgi:DNA adenine methylase